MDRKVFLRPARRRAFPISRRSDGANQALVKKNHEPGPLELDLPVGTLEFETVIRSCTRSDLSKLEWGGLFWEHHNTIWTAYNRQQRGENLMLIAEANQWPIGQVWIDVKKKRPQGVGILWALRTAPGFQNLGLGSCLIAAAELVLGQLDFAVMELGVEKSNRDAIRLYERLGFQCVGQQKGAYRYTNPLGVRKRMPFDEWIYQRAVLENSRGPCG